MHICFVCNEYPPTPHGGIGSFTQTLGRALVKRGQRVTVIGGYPDQYAGMEDDEGVHVIRLSRKGPPLVRFGLNRARLAKRLRQLDEQHPIDIIEGSEVEIWALNRSAPGIKVLRMHGGPHFFSTTPRPPLVKNLKERWAFHVADQLCAVSQCVADGTRKLLRLGDRHIEVIPNPIDIDLFAPAPADAEESGLIVFAGTINERKGIRQLIQAMPRIVAAVPEAHLEAYGGDAVFPANSISFTKTLAASIPAELTGHIQWKGRVSRAELPGALKRASVCVYPSHMEAMPIAWLEGLAAGKAVVASRTGPGPEIIDDGVTGLLCNPQDPNSIAEKVVTLLKDADLRRKMGSAARKIAVERYSLDRLVDRNLEYYRRLVETPKSHRHL